MDVLRLAGVPGVGKSTVAWAIARQLAADGVRTGYVDIDQLGMCYPAPVGDPDRWDLKETALARVAGQFAAAGVERLVVSGVADPAETPRGNGYPTVSLWLDADEATRRERLIPRGWAKERVDDVLAVGSTEAQVAHVSWARVVTDGRTVEETVRAVLTRWGTGLVEPAPARVEQEATGRMIWITGPRCAGASTVGWEVASALWSEGQRTGFLDVAQLGFAWNVDREVGPQNAAELQRHFAAAEARTVIVVAPFEIGPEEVRAGFPRADVQFFRLDADIRTLRDRAVLRAGGEGPQVAGDDLLGASADEIDTVVKVAVRQSRIPTREGELVIDSTGATPSQLARRLSAHLPD